MALWQFLTNGDKGEHWADGDPWDDGLTKRPGDAGFSLSAVIAQAMGRFYNYICTPNWNMNNA